MKSPRFLEMQHDARLYMPITFDSISKVVVLIRLLKLFIFLGNAIVVSIAMLDTMVMSDPSKRSLPLSREPHLCLCLMFPDDLEIVGRYPIANVIIDFCIWFMM